MSLNGLDEQPVVDAFNAAIAEPGGWLALKYASRDTVELLATGKSGVTEARNALLQYEDKSPLYAMLMFRRKRVLVKYIPEGTSRVLVARTNVHFPSISEHYAPHEAVIEIVAAEELNDTSLAAVFPLHTGTSGTTTGKLDEIMEGGTDDDSGDEPVLSRPPMQQRSTSGTSMSRKELLAQKGMKYKRLPSIPAKTSDPETAEPAAAPAPEIVVEEEEHQPAVEGPPDGLRSHPVTMTPAVPAVSTAVPVNVADPGRSSTELTPVISLTSSAKSECLVSASQKDVEESQLRPSTAPARQEPPKHISKDMAKADKSKDLDAAALDALLPLPELGPRPVPRSKAVKGSSGLATPARTSAPLPAALRSRHKSMEKDSTLPKPKPNLTPLPQRLAPVPQPAPTLLPQTPIRPASSSSVRSFATARSKKALTPEKQRLLKALELRQKQKAKANAAAEAAAAPVAEPSAETFGLSSVDDSAQPADSVAGRMTEADRPLEDNAAQVEGAAGAAGQSEKADKLVIDATVYSADSVADAAAETAKPSEENAAPVETFPGTVDKAAGDIAHSVKNNTKSLAQLSTPDDSKESIVEGAETEMSSDSTPTMTNKDSITPTYTPTGTDLSNLSQPTTYTPIRADLSILSPPSPRDNDEVLYTPVAMDLSILSPPETVTDSNVQVKDTVASQISADEPTTIPAATIVDEQFATPAEQPADRFMTEYVNDESHRKAATTTSMVDRVAQLLKFDSAPAPTEMHLDEVQPHQEAVSGVVGDKFYNLPTSPALIQPVATEQMPTESLTPALAHEESQTPKLTLEDTKSDATVDAKSKDHETRLESDSDSSTVRNQQAPSPGADDDVKKDHTHGVSNDIKDVSETSFLLSPGNTGNAMSSPVDVMAADGELLVSTTNADSHQGPAQIDGRTPTQANEALTENDTTMIASDRDMTDSDVSISDEFTIVDADRKPRHLIENSARKSDSGIQLNRVASNSPRSSTEELVIKDESSNATLNDSLLTVEQPARTETQTIPSHTAIDKADTSFSTVNRDYSPNTPSEHDNEPSLQNHKVRLHAPLPLISHDSSPTRSERFSGATVDSDMMEAFDAATVHEATVAVQRSPSATFFKRSSSGGNNTTLQQLTAGSQVGECNDTSSFGDLLVPTSIFNPRSSTLILPPRPMSSGGVSDAADLIGTSRRGSVKPGISERIAKLEQLRSNQTTGTALPPLSMSNGSPGGVDRSLSERKGLRKVLSSDEPEGVRERLKSISGFGSPRSSPIRSSMSSFQSSNSPVRPHTAGVSSATQSSVAPHFCSLTPQEVVSVTARIIHADDVPPQVPPKDDKYMPAELRAPAISVDRKRATWSQTLSAKDSIALSTTGLSPVDIEDKSPTSPVSAMSRKSNERRLSFGRRKNGKADAFTPHLSSPEEDTVADLPGESPIDDADSPRSTNRATRFLKRMSTLGQATQIRRKGGSVTPSPVKSHFSSAAPSAAPSPVAPTTPAPPALSLGNINVQFPNSVLWRRRFIELDATGTVVLTANKLGFGIHSSTRKYRMTDFTKIYLPDMDAQELAHSIFLDLRDGGGMLQCACEDVVAQQHTLQTLLTYHAYWSEHANAE